MIPLALMLLASAQHLEVVNEPFQIPAGKWYQAGLGLKQGRPVVVSAVFERASQPTSLALMRREDLDRLLEGGSNRFLAKTARGTAGTLRYLVRVPGYYVIFLDNRAGTVPIAGHLRVALDFSGERVPEVTQLSRERQITIIAISFAVFFAIAGYSARRLLRAIRH